jgi:small-conductance mechanosensitive channel
MISTPDVGEPAPPSKPWSPGDDPKAVLELLERRRLAIDQVMWQAPALVVTAHSFLFLAALNPSFPKWGRIAVLVAGLSAVIAAFHSLAKQRYLEIVHTQAIKRCMTTLRYPNIYRGELASLWPDREARHEHTRSLIDLETVLGPKGYEELIVKIPSYQLWLLTFVVFGSVDVFIFAVLTGMGWWGLAIPGALAIALFVVRHWPDGAEPSGPARGSDAAVVESADISK